MYTVRTWSRATTTAVLAFLAASCDSGDGIVKPGDQADGRILITNDEGVLQGRISRPGTVIPIDPPAPGLFPPQASSRPLAAPKKDLSLTLEAEVSPPTVNGEVVQATSVVLQGTSKALVSYNMRGAPRLGGMDWLTNLTTNPRIGASATFNDSDVSAVSFDGSFAYAAEATGATEFPYPAVLERLRVVGNGFSLDGNLRVPLTSYVATSTMVTGGAVYATSGDGGHITAFDKNTFALLGQYPLDDARWVAWDEQGGRVVVAQGTPGRLSVFAEGDFPGGSLNRLNTFTFPGAGVAESKSTVEILGGKAFVAAGPEGVQIVCLDDGQVVGSVPRPDPAALGLDPSVVVTNAVSVDGDVMFISNGEAGVYVAQGDEDFGTSGCAQQTITMLGHVRFDNLQSANHVDYKSKWLMVAAGLGGVKVVEVGGL
jgi:outer membrane protein assembly factor BamB